MRVKKLCFFRKNKNFFKIKKLHLELLKTKHLLHFFLVGLKKKQLLNLYKIISRKYYWAVFISKLENRLDFILLKSNFALTGKQAKQLVVHKQIYINGLLSYSPNSTVKEYDIISLAKISIFSIKNDLFFNMLNTPLYFSYLRKKKRILKKTKLPSLFTYFKFSLFLEINFKTFTILVLKKNKEYQASFLAKTASLYDYNQLYFLL